MELINPALDNHFGENWTADSVENVLYTSEIITMNQMVVFPNPARDRITISIRNNDVKYANIYNLTGQNIAKVILNKNGAGYFDFSDYKAGLYIIRAERETQKVVLVK